MTRWLLLALVAAIAATHTSEAAAQAALLDPTCDAAAAAVSTANQRCVNEFARRAAAAAAAPGAPAPAPVLPSAAVQHCGCYHLATQLGLSVAANAAATRGAYAAAGLPPQRPTLSARAVQARVPDQTGGGASQGSQAVATPSVQPIPLAGGALAIAGTRQGPREVTVVSLNPLALFARNDNPEQVARFSRVFDVTLTLPINIAAIGTAASMGSFWNTLDYFGLRVRVSFLGSARAARLIAESETAFRVSLGAATSFDAALARVLVGAANANTIEQCAAAIASASDAHTADVELQCGAPMPSEQVRLRDAATEADAAARRAVDEADRSYVGLDLRGDFGDPTFSGLAMSRGVNALGALAFGGRIDAGAVGIWLRGRAGFSYSSINNYAENAYSADFGVAIALAFGQATAANAVQRLHVNLGLEGRFGSGSMANTAGLTNFLDLRLGVGVPVSDGTSIGVGASIPLYGSTSPIFTVTGNWALLFPDAAPARR